MVDSNLTLSSSVGNLGSVLALEGPTPVFVRFLLLYQRDILKKYQDKFKEILDKEKRIYRGAIVKYRTDDLG